MNEKVARALSYVDTKYISEAVKRKKKGRRLLAAAAAVLALVMLWNTPSIPLAVSAKAVSIASESRKMERPDINSDEFDLWFEQRNAREETVNGALGAIMDFSSACSRKVLSGSNGENHLWSPINAYIALAMTAELAGGDTRRNILKALGVSDIVDLRKNIAAVWESVYRDDGREVSVLANSLWLDGDISYQQETMDILSYHYYASVYQGDLGSDQTNRAIGAWLNNQTGGFLKDRTGNVELTPNSVMALVSTIYFQSQWSKQFDSGSNTQNLFHTAAGDVECTYLNARERQMNYFWAGDYGAVSLSLENGSSMWLILPDVDKTVEDVLRSEEYASMIARSDGFPEENHKWMKVNLSVPKFDVSGSTDLKDALKSMGLTAIFEPLGNDFSASVDSEIPVYLESIRQDTRVAIDEEGVIAASYIELEFGAGAAMPPDEVIDFVLDRPFLFVISSGDGIPLFMGVVNTPE